MMNYTDKSFYEIETVVYKSKSYVKKMSKYDLQTTVYSLQQKIKVLEQQKSNIPSEDELKVFEIKENEIICNRMEFLKMFNEHLYLIGYNYQVYLFGGFLRRKFEKFSKTKEEHIKRMENLINSDLDISLSTKDGNYYSLNLKNMLERLIRFSLFDLLKVESHKELVKNQIVTEFIKFSVKYKGQIINIDLYNTIPTDDFFGPSDYDVNMLLMDGSGNLCLREYTDEDNYGSIFNIIENIGKKKANPRFKKILLNSINKFRTSAKLLERQQKMIDEGYQLSGFIKCTQPHDDCGICRDKIKEDKPVIAVCSCKNSIEHFCNTCIQSTINTGNFKCPYCRKPMETILEYVEKRDNINIFPEMERIVIDSTSIDIPDLSNWRPRNQ